MFKFNDAVVEFVGLLLFLIFKLQNVWFVITSGDKGISKVLFFSNLIPMWEVQMGDDSNMKSGIN